MRSITLPPSQAVHESLLSGIHGVSSCGLKLMLSFKLADAYLQA